MAFRDLAEFLSVEPLRLPVRGKVYEFPGEVSARTGLRLERLWAQLQTLAAGGALEADILSDEEQAELEHELFGKAESEMVTDGCTMTELSVVRNTLLVYYLRGEESAEAFWNAQGEARAPSRDDGARPKPSRARGSRAGSKTPRARKARAGGTSSAAGAR
jgi:hypothetical protein